MSVTVLISVLACGHVSVCDRVRVHDRDRVRVRDIIRYILSVSVVVPDTSSARSWGRDHEFERVTVRVVTCTFSLAVSVHNEFNYGILLTTAEYIRFSKRFVIVT